MTEAYERFRSNHSGKICVYPALARVPSDLLGICVVGAGGNVYAVGDSDHSFTIMSVSKPFVLALVIERWGADAVRDRIGVNGTTSVQLGRGRRARR